MRGTSQRAAWRAGDLLDDAAEDRGLAQRARPRLAQGEHDALVEGRRLVQRLLERLPSQYAQLHRHAQRAPGEAGGRSSSKAPCPRDAIGGPSPRPMGASRAYPPCVKGNEALKARLIPPHVVESCLDSAYRNKTAAKSASRPGRDLVKVIIEAFVELQVFHNSWKQNQVVESLRHSVLQTGCEYPRTRVKSIVTPPATNPNQGQLSMQQPIKSHVGGFVMPMICSQFVRLGAILRALGNFPDL
jgi:hypothetical protein